MYNSLLTKTKKQYSIYSSEQPFVCAGTRKDCQGELYNGAKQIAFGKVIEDTTHVTLKPNLKKIQNCKNLDFLPETITHLRVPLPLLPLLSRKKLPNLQHITVLYFYQYEELDLNLSDIYLDPDFDLRSFEYFPDADEDRFLWFDTAINLHDYGNLEYISCSLKNDGSSFNYISKLTQVKHFSLLCDRLDTLECIPKTAKLLYLPCNNKKKDFSTIGEFTDLQLLGITGLHSEFDCELLTSLPLNEIFLGSMKKVLHPLSLLDIASLERVCMMDCNNPLKKKGRELFSKHGFLDLDVEYS